MGYVLDQCCCGPTNCGKYLAALPDILNCLIEPLGDFNCPWLCRNFQLRRGNNPPPGCGYPYNGDLYTGCIDQAGYWRPCPAYAWIPTLISFQCAADAGALDACGQGPYWTLGIATQEFGLENNCSQIPYAKWCTYGNGDGHNPDGSAWCQDSLECGGASCNTCQVNTRAPLYAEFVFDSSDPASCPCTGGLPGMCTQGCPNGCGLGAGAPYHFKVTVTE